MTRAPHQRQRIPNSNRQGIKDADAEEVCDESCDSLRLFFVDDGCHRRHRFRPTKVKR